MFDSAPSSSSPVLSILIAFALVVVGACLLLPSASILLFAQQSRSWPTVDGQVASSNVERRWASREDGPMQDYIFEVWYSYYVDGKDYISDQVYPGQEWTKFRHEAEAVAAHYPQGGRVKVYYDPKAPGSSVLEPDRVPVMVNARLGGGIVLILFGFLSLGALIKRFTADDQE